MRHRMVNPGFANNMNAADLLWSALHLQGIADEVLAGRNTEFSLIEAVEALADNVRHYQ